MPRAGNINPTNPNAEILGDIFAGPTPNGYSFGVPVSVSVPISADASVHSIPCPLDGPSLATAFVDVRTAEAGRSINVGISNASNPTAAGDTLLDGVALTTVGVRNPIDHSGTNHALSRKINPNQFITWQCSTGTSSVVAYLVLTFTPLGG